MDIRLTHPIRDAAGMIHNANEALTLLNRRVDGLGRILLTVRGSSGAVIVVFPEEVTFPEENRSQNG